MNKIKKKDPNSTPSQESSAPVDPGNQVVKKPEDETYIRKEAMTKDRKPAQTREKSEQPVHPIKK